MAADALTSLYGGHLTDRTKRTSSSSVQLRVVGLFAGIGGIELGLHQAGHKSQLLCEIDPGASHVLRRRFPDVRIIEDVRNIEKLPTTDLVAAGFPCQDLSQAGRTAGIAGSQSGLVEHLFRLLDASKRSPRWLLLENVSFMLHLDRGRGMRYLVDQLETRGYRWAYRIVDTQAFGVPQRRQRVIMLASRREDPRNILFVDDAEPREPMLSEDTWCGFYWTEGLRGLGWAVDGVPTLKVGSTIGIPSPPAIWKRPSGEIATPDIRDAERLQGFETDWTTPALEIAGVRKGHRWKLVGNAVSVPVSKWLGDRLANPGDFDRGRCGALLGPGVTWPAAACGHGGRVYPVAVSRWPVSVAGPHLRDFLKFPPTPLSARAAAGFKNRMDVSSLNFNAEFRAAMRRYVECAVRPAVVA